jgi:PAS domain-containing protein
MVVGVDWPTSLISLLARVMTSPKRKRAEMPFRRQEQRLKDAQALGKIGDWEFDVRTGLINWSDEVYRLFERDPAMGPPAFSEMLAGFFPEDALRLQECVRLAIETGASYQLDLHVRLPSGRDAYHFAIGRASKDNEGKVIKLHGIAQDVTERRRAQDALAESEREQRRIALELETERSRLVEAQKVAGVGSWENDLATSELTWSGQT